VTDHRDDERRQRDDGEVDDETERETHSRETGGSDEGRETMARLARPPETGDHRERI